MRRSVCEMKKKSNFLQKKFFYKKNNKTKHFSL